MNIDYAINKYTIQDEINQRSKLFLYQIEGIDLICNKYKDVLLADHPGAGKTCQAVIAAQDIGAVDILVICPASLRENWKREFAKWSVKKFNLSIISYDAAATRSLNAEKEILEPIYDLLILDECHYLKNPTSQRTKGCLGYYWNMAKKRICISGTPLPNGRAIEGWALFSKLAPELFKNKREFISNFCVKQKSRWGVNYDKSKNLELLGKLARSKFMIRRKRKETVGQLPPLIRQMAYLDGILALQLDYKIDEDNITPETISAWRKHGLSKVLSSVEYIKTLLKEVSQVVVFAHHKDVLSELKNRLEANTTSCCLFTGDTPTLERQQMVDDFQNGKYKVFLASLHAAGVGITLTKSSDVVFVECDWVPGVNEQAEGRCFRITQENVTRSHYLVIPDSLDERITSIVLRKQRDITQVMRD